MFIEKILSQTQNGASWMILETHNGCVKIILSSNIPHYCAIGTVYKVPFIVKHFLYCRFLHMHEEFIIVSFCEKFPSHDKMVYCWNTWNNSWLKVYSGIFVLTARHPIHFTISSARVNKESTVLCLHQEIPVFFYYLYVHKQCNSGFLCVCVYISVTVICDIYSQSKGLDEP